MNIGTVIFRQASPNLAVTSGAGANNSAQTGTIIDRKDTNYSQYCELLFPYVAVLTATKVFNLKTILVESSAESNMGNATTLFSQSALTTIATGPQGGGTLRGTYKIGIPLGPAKRYLRVKYTPGLDNGSADTLAVSAQIAFDTPYTQVSGN